MLKNLGGTRAFIAYILIAGFIAACFTNNMSDVKFTAIGTMATTAVTFYFSNKATKDQQQKTADDTAAVPDDNTGKDKEE
jgi:mannose/fructose/N-acetylgalactosamine-specific phosphotransferase system component IIC